MKAWTEAGCEPGVKAGVIVGVREGVRLEVKGDPGVPSPPGVRAGDEEKPEFRL
jgi:hypothetical protein